MAARILDNKPHGGAYEGFPDGPEAFRGDGGDAALRKLFQAAVAHAQNRIDWYDRKAGEKGKVARRLRWSALLLFAVGTLAPIVLTLLVKLAEAFSSRTPPDTLALIAKLPLAEIGFVSLGIAGALVIFDQFFDASGSWIRFRQAQARLEVLLADLRYAWAMLLAKSGGLTTDHAVAGVTLLREFVVKVEQLAEVETREWAERFRARIDSFDSNPNLKVRLDTRDVTNHTRAETPVSGESEHATPVTRFVPIEIKNVTNLDPGSLHVTVDGAEKPVPASGVLRLPLTDGVIHNLVATATRGGQPLRAELRLRPGPGDDGRTFTLALPAA